MSGGHIVVGFAISAYHHQSCEFESGSNVLDAKVCDKVCQWL